MNIPFHPAPGIGELLPGFFVVPQNPIRDAMGGCALSGCGMKYQPHIGELLPASFNVPQNPIVKNIQTGMGGLARGSFEGFTGGMAGMGGLGEFDMASLSPGSWSKTTWMVVAGVGIMLIMMSRPGKSAYQAAMSQARADYSKKVSEIRGKYKRVGQRLGRGVVRAGRHLIGEEA